MSNNWQFRLFAQKGTGSSFVQPLLLLQLQSAEFGTASLFGQEKSAAVSSNAFGFCVWVSSCWMARGCLLLVEEILAHAADFATVQFGDGAVYGQALMFAVFDNEITFVDIGRQCFGRNASRRAVSHINDSAFFFKMVDETFESGHKNPPFGLVQLIADKVLGLWQVADSGNTTFSVFHVIMVTEMPSF